MTRDKPSDRLQRYYIFKIKFGFQVPERSSDTTANVDDTKLVSPTCSQTSPIGYVLGKSVVSRLTQGIEVVPSGSTPSARQGSRGWRPVRSATVLAVLAEGRRFNPPAFPPAQPSRAASGGGCALAAGMSAGSATRAMTMVKKSENHKVPSHHSSQIP